MRLPRALTDPVQTDQDKVLHFHIVGTSTNFEANGIDVVGVYELIQLLGILKTN